jgi:predicted Zn-dependent protease
MLLHFNLRVASVGFALLAIGSGAFAQDKSTKPTPEDNEIKLGRDNAAEVEKSVKLITDPAVVERVQRIGKEIAAVANRLEVQASYGDSTVKQFEYTFKVIDDKDINAFSLPGGFIYVHSGLLNYIQSDDELAGVLAHEVAHASHHHMMKLIAQYNKEQKKLIFLVPLIALGGGGAAANLGNLLMAGQLYLVAKQNTWGMDAERDADQAGMEYLRHTKYNPVGELTFMERLARDELARPQVEWGIYRTHPPSPERARALTAKLESLNIPINRRDTDASIRAIVEASKLNGSDVATVKMSKTQVARFAPFDGMTALERAKDFAAKVNSLFDDKLQMFEIRTSADKTKVSVRGVTVYAAYDADSQAFGLTRTELAASTQKALTNLLFRDSINRIPGSDPDLKFKPKGGF